ncbi:MAG: translation initiation factor IF-2 N-terminal domain-containing protein, partial [Daejeonella sp.]|uniref:translation initiation factor IF-2 N-terminal domain-containing protein n=1 Tax=Daejeonella sp. TaxID=2805397 RepID=UPI003C758D43
MSEGKSTNLLKTAKELNIGLSTAVEFLGKKGFKVEPRPNTKLTDEMYDVLLKEYQGDKTVKEEAKQIVIGKIRRDDLPVSPEKVEPVSRSKDFEQEEILIKNVSSYTPPVVEKPKPAPAEPVAEQPKVEVGALPGVKIVGKINLDDLNSKTRPEKKAAEAEKPVVEIKPEAPVAPKPVEAVKAVEPKPEPVPEKVVELVAKPVVEQVKEVEKPAPAVSPVAEVEKTPAPAPEIKAETPPAPKADEKVENKPNTQESNPDATVIRAKAERLTGPNVIGRIELPVTPARRGQPVASSSSAAGADHKRKRKRKDNAPGQPPQTGGQQPGAPRPAPAPGAGGGYQGNRPDFRNTRPGQGTAGGTARPDFRNKARTDSTPKAEPTDKEIQDQIKATLARLSGAGKSGKFAQRAKLRRQKRDDVAQTAEEAAMELEMQSKTIKVTEFVTANELALMLDVPVTQIISTCMSLGMFVSINQRLDAETLTIVADEFGYEVEFVKPEDEESGMLEEEDDEASLIPRAPIVTVMGHVDHGKTSLLDFVRKTNVIAGEAGGITQHIGAYEVTLENERKITFLDTPGHEAFTAMRARGAKVTDIAIIVIAADDSVMPQTREAINHAQAANVPIVFAFSKVDKPGANADKIREQLSTMNILVEDWGGKYQSQEISGKTGMGIDLLLEKVLLEADMLELTANPNKRAVGTVIEAALDKGRGIVTTVLIQAGTLKVGDAILAGGYSGRVKA